MKVKEPTWLVLKGTDGLVFTYKDPSEWIYNDEEWAANWRKLNNPNNSYSDPEHRLYNFLNIFNTVKTRLFTDLQLQALRDLKNFQVGDLFSADKTKRNDVDYTKWNKLFNKTGLNEYFGYDPSVQKHYGPSTAARYALLQMIDFVDNASKNGNENLGNNKSGGPEKPNLRTYKPLQFAALPELYKNSWWSDWMPHLGTLFANRINNIRNLNLEQLQVYPKKEPKRIEVKESNNYLGLQYLQLAAADVRSRGEQGLTNDMSLNLKLRLAYEDKASQYLDKALELNTTARAESDQLVNKAKTYNNAQEVDAANYNTASDKAKWNSMLLARQKYNESNTKAITDYINNMYTDFTQWLEDERKNKLHFVLGQKLLEAQRNIENIYNLFKAKSSDITQTTAYKDWYKNYTKAGGPRIALNDDGTVNQDAAKLAFLTGTDNASISARLAYLKELELMLLNLYNDIGIVRGNLQAWQSTQPYIINGLIYPSGLFAKPKISSAPIIRKSGGKVSRLIDYANTNKKSADKYQERQLKANKLSSDHLDKELERINKLQLALMRALFK